MGFGTGGRTRGRRGSQIVWKDIVRVALAASLWVASLALMMAATLSGELVVAGWSILFALWGSIFTGWHLLAMERVRTETIARIAAEASMRHVRLESVD